mmetsp:Transcript_4949/g.12410  ORF Transcript_4949/g.12410 Transcript_4949/m.12410 type:complete len:503 (+) Transcript_4949:572-2080(+)|eukprot:CAMPEP_0178989806 /NCGR_PEP_ID=MMETSP0795-20121207/4583_1 /TAXON_ID=88552 /ORGANISM="Amoebophrya sp., Strain Ameob2" /LENGTH=502 /DNA_ID=CAMNT_0020681257 /DNA_START=550 /DNA_END=2058 /DNA_ORIENTATION=-
MATTTSASHHLQIGAHAQSGGSSSSSAVNGGQSALEKAQQMVIKADVNKEGWESSDFPVLCETCLGPNPFTRMAKEDYGIECKICTRPFTLFRWKPGGDARYKATVICQTCARLKNCCQTCLFDLEYGLPVAVRDHHLAEQDKIQMPDSIVNREYYINQQSAKIETGELPYGKEKNPMLMKLARKNPYYKRNEARICSFFVKGTCNRGDECPFRHEMPATGELAKQNVRDRFHGTNDPLAAKIMRQAKEQFTLKPPDDKSITTLYVGGVDPSLTEQDLRNVFYVHGELRMIKMIPKQSCAFVVYKTREGAEAAADKLYKNLKIKGHSLRIQWGQKQTPAGAGREDQEKAEAEKKANERDPLAAPGGPMRYQSMNPMSLNNAPLLPGGKQGGKDGGKNGFKGKDGGKFGSGKMKGGKGGDIKGSKSGGNAGETVDPYFGGSSGSGGGPPPMMAMGGGGGLGGPGGLGEVPLFQGSEYGGQSSGKLGSKAVIPMQGGGKAKGGF